MSSSTRLEVVDNGSPARSAMSVTDTATLLASKTSMMRTARCSTDSPDVDLAITGPRQCPPHGGEVSGRIASATQQPDHPGRQRDESPLQETTRLWAVSPRRFRWTIGSLRRGAR
jgi:hypothetical protein